MTTIRKAYEFKLYKSVNDNHLHDMLNVAGIIYNHSLSLHKRYYRLYGKNLNKRELKAHLSKLRNTSNSHWMLVNMQSIQNIADRLELSYKRFFDFKKVGKKASPPSHKKCKKYKSVTFYQSGAKLMGGNVIRIMGKRYKFHKSREIEGKVKEITLKRLSNGTFKIYVTVVQEVEKEPTLSNITGFDFGLKNFLVGSDGTCYNIPKELKDNSKKLSNLKRKLSKKRKGSGNYKRCAATIARLSQKDQNQRKDFHFKLANKLLSENKIICFEDLDMAGMGNNKLISKSVYAAGFSKFIDVLKYKSLYYDCEVVFIDRYYPSTKTCSNCGCKKDMPLNVRIYECGKCGHKEDRDLNAAKNIKKAGLAALMLDNVSLYNQQLSPDATNFA